MCYAKAWNYIGYAHDMKSLLKGPWSIFWEAYYCEPTHIQCLQEAFHRENLAIGLRPV